MEKNIGYGLVFLATVLLITVVFIAANGTITGLLLFATMLLTVQCLAAGLWLIKKRPEKAKKAKRATRRKEIRDRWRRS